MLTIPLKFLKIPIIRTTLSGTLLGTKFTSQPKESPQTERQVKNESSWDEMSWPRGDASASAAATNALYRHRNAPTIWSRRTRFWRTPCCSAVNWWAMTRLMKRRKTRSAESWPVCRKTTTSFRRTSTTNEIGKLRLAAYEIIWLPDPKETLPLRRMSWVYPIILYRKNSVLLKEDVTCLSWCNAIQLY